MVSASEFLIRLGRCLDWRELLSSILQIPPKSAPSKVRAGVGESVSPCDCAWLYSFLEKFLF